MGWTLRGKISAGESLSLAALTAMLFVAPVPAVAAPAAPATAPPIASSTPFDGEVLAAKMAMMGEPQAAFLHARSAAALAAALPAGSDRDVAVLTAQWLEGESSTRMRKPADAMAYLEPAVVAAARLKPDSKLQGDVLKSRGRASAALGKVQAALGDYQAAFHIYQRANEPRAQAMVLQDIGSVYMDARDYDHVLQYYKQSGEVFASDPVLSLTAHNNRGIALKALNRMPEALVEFRGALAAAVQAKSAFLQAHILSDIAFTDVSLHDYAQARADVARGLALGVRDEEARAERPFLLGALARIEAERGDLPRATRTLDQAFAGVDIAKTTMDYRDFHENAARIYDRAGQAEIALQHLKAFKRLDDQGRELAASTNAALMSARFDFANQDLKIAKLKAGQLEAEARLRNLILAGLLLAGGFIFAVTLLGFLSMRRSRNRIRAANAQLGVANNALEKALKAKTEFLATTSHEIRTPLNGILGMTQVILAGADVPASVRERLQLVQGAGETMKTLVDDLLDVAKVETGAITITPEAFELRRALKDTAAFWAGQAEGKHLKLTLDASEAPRAIVADEARLRQVLYNLMSNALKFTEEGEVSLTVRAEGEELVFEVHDTGIGIPAHEHERIFEAFVQVDGGTSRKYGGTGLGLSICRSVSAAMGGSVSVRSQEGEGSTFTVRIPLVRAESAEADASIAADGLGSAAVLVIDRNPLAQGMLRAVLEPACRGVAFSSALEEAIDHLASAGADLVFADGAALALEGSARAVVARLRQAGHSVRIAIILPLTEAAQAAEWTEAGVDTVIVKPIAASDLLARLDAALASGLCVDPALTVAA